MATILAIVGVVFVVITLIGVILEGASGYALAEVVPEAGILLAAYGLWRHSPRE
jgi:hypothetical protein